MKNKIVSCILVGIFSVFLGKVASYAIPIGPVMEQSSPGISPVIGNYENLARQEPTPSAVDGIEDAIFAALEAAQEETTPAASRITNRPQTPQDQQHQQPQYPAQQQQQHPGFGQFGHILPALAATGSPAEYFGGIVGNLAGVADNTLKLVGTSTHSLLGVAAHVSCTLNPMCPNNANNKGK